MESIFCICGALLLEVSPDGLESRLVGGKVGLGGGPCCHACDLPLEGESDREILLRALREAWLVRPEHRVELRTLAAEVQADRITVELCRKILALRLEFPGEMPCGNADTFPELNRAAR